MNTYSRALRHISMKDVKQKHQKKLIEQKIQEEKKKEEEEYIASVMEEKKYDWREKLNESMTSSGMFFTTLPATGDVDLTVTSLDASGYEIDADVSFSSGTNSGFTGGFSSDNGIINLGGEGEYATGVVSNTFDFSTVDTVNITAIAGNNSNGGMLPTSSLELYFFTDDDVSDGIQVIPTSASSFATINVNIPEKFRTSSVGLVFLSDTSDGNGYHGRHFRNQTIPISGLNHTIMGNLFPQTATITGINAGPSNLISFYLRTNRNSQSDYETLGEYIWFNSMSQRFGWFDNVGTPEDPELVYRTWPAAPISGATTEDAITAADYRYIGQTVYNLFKGTKLYGISNISFRRKTPMNVLVPLDSPEATSFVRTDPMMANLSPQERLKKLKDMLEASDEYVMKMLGLDFPGTGSVPPGEYDPFKQAPPGEAGDTPGVEIAGTPAIPSYVRDSIMRQYGKPGYGKFTPEDQKNIIQWQQKLKQADTGTQDTQIAQNWTDDPSTWPSIKNPVKSAPAIIDPKTGWPSVPNVPPSYKGKPGGTKLKLAHYEPEGELILEKKKLKSPEEILNKIPGYYDGKPAPLGFPVEPPPKMVNGMHPDLVDGKKVADRFNRLDPESAKAMPPTGNPHIDKKVRAARKKSK